MKAQQIIMDYITEMKHDVTASELIRKTIPYAAEHGVSREEAYDLITDALTC